MHEFHADNLSLHENGMRITALAGDKCALQPNLLPIGGGFIVDEEHFGLTTNSEPVNVTYLQNRRGFTAPLP